MIVPPCPDLQWKSAEPAASRTLLGCQSRLSTVERMDFLMCLLSHLVGVKGHSISYSFFVDMYFVYRERRGEDIKKRPKPESNPVLYRNR